jgi:hypothetical protein
VEVVVQVQLVVLRVLLQEEILELHRVVLVVLD